MNEGFSAIDAVVLAAAGFVAVMVAAWLVSPRLRKWIERPKYRFVSDMRSYEKELKR